MRCYSCGATLSEDDFCNACGADVKSYKRIIRLSNSCYNEGLKRAKIRDLSGAVSSLKESLKCNKTNIEARNLLGLVYFEMGEVVLALSEWIISKNYRAKNNIADDFMQEVQENPAKLEMLNTSIKKYNQALDYCAQGSYDLAIIQLKSVVSKNPKLVRGYQLLGLLYLQGEQWEKAKKALNRALRVDAGNPETRYYLSEAEQALNELAAVPAENRMKTREEAITYQSGNETIIQPLNTQERSGSITVLNIIIGLAIGAAIMWFLILPARIQSARKEINEELQNVSDELTSKSADLEEMDKRLEALQNENNASKEELESYTGSSGMMNSFDGLFDSAALYINDPGNAREAAKLLEGVSENASSRKSYQNLYSVMFSKVGSEAASAALDSGKQCYNTGDYTGAIVDLTEAFGLNSSLDEALYYLAQSYLKSGDETKGRELLNQLTNTFPDSEYAGRAKDYLSTGNTDETPAETGQEENDNGETQERKKKTEEQTEAAAAVELPAVPAPAATPTPAPVTQAPAAIDELQAGAAQEGVF
ncbi:MAG: tetratricopeptide repeat protein [Lachnospiraceae bacterium]|nr:tetratricopeptide repeat protein [Lachnospiraceae bacterium]